MNFSWTASRETPGWLPSKTSRFSNGNVRTCASCSSARAARSGARRATPTVSRYPWRSSRSMCQGCSVTTGSEDDVTALATRTQRGDRLVEDVLGLGVGAALLHVGKVGLVGL